MHYSCYCTFLRSSERYSVSFPLTYFKAASILYASLPSILPITLPMAVYIIEHNITVTHFRAVNVHTTPPTFMSDGKGSLVKEQQNNFAATALKAGCNSTC